MELKKFLKEFEQPKDIESGGSNVAPEARLLLVSLALLLDAEDILELGYDAGYSTKALAETGADVVGVDNLTQYPEVDEDAKKMLRSYKNVKLVEKEAVEFLRVQKDDSFDLIYVDDNHEIVHVRDELIEVRRVLRAGGIVVVAATADEGVRNSVHDTLRDWQRVFLPGKSPLNGSEVGYAIARKPL